MNLAALLKSRRNIFISAAVLLFLIVVAIIVFVVSFPSLNFLKPQNSKQDTTSSANKATLPVANNRVMGPVKNIEGSTITFEGVGENKSYQINLAGFSKIKDSQTNKSLKITDIVVGETIAVWSDQEMNEGLIPTSQIAEVTVFTNTNLQIVNPKNIPSVGQNTEEAKDQKK